MSGENPWLPGFDISPLSIIRMLWKRKWIVALIWLAVTPIGLVVVQRMRPLYKAEALILVDSQKIPESFVSSTVRSDVQDRFATITKQIQSSSQLNAIIESFNLYPEERQKRFQEEVLVMMRRDITITPEKGAFRVGYQGPDPVIVARVANRIANLYIEENFKHREIQAEGTSEFLEAQLTEAKKRLDEMEAAVSSYKLRHNGELPQQENSLNGMLNRLQVELEANRDAINRAQESSVMLENAISMAEQTMAAQMRPAETLPGAAAPAVAVVNPVSEARPVPPRKSEALQAQLETLRIRYSEDHPDVKRLQWELGQARKQEAKVTVENAASAAPAEVAPVQRPAAASLTARTNPELARTQERIESLRTQLGVAKREMEHRKGEQKRILADIAVHQSRVNRLPIREQEMAQITRDYEIAKVHYRSLLDKKISAAMSTDMERRQKSERFTIGDPAHVPGKPFRPNRPLLYGVCCVAGLLLGLVVAMGKEFREGKLLGEWQLPRTVPVLARLPEIEPRGAKVHRFFPWRLTT